MSNACGAWRLHCRCIVGTNELLRPVLVKRGTWYRCDMKAAWAEGKTHKTGRFQPRCRLNNVAMKWLNRLRSPMTDRIQIYAGVSSRFFSILLQIKRNQMRRKRATMVMSFSGPLTRVRNPSDAPLLFHVICHQKLNSEFAPVQFFSPPLRSSAVTNKVFLSQKPGTKKFFNYVWLQKWNSFSPPFFVT